MYGTIFPLRFKENEESQFGTESVSELGKYPLKQLSWIQFRIILSLSTGVTESIV